MANRATAQLIKTYVVGEGQDSPALLLLKFVPPPPARPHSSRPFAMAHIHTNSHARQ